MEDEVKGQHKAGGWQPPSLGCPGAEESPNWGEHGFGMDGGAFGKWQPQDNTTKHKQSLPWMDKKGNIRLNWKGEVTLGITALWG